ncbi:MAG: hypothetical protein L0206_21430, partial [Actinobacteria bacterium]|nr:hypothetical protein [Actinomycetota bacterium]
IACPCTALEPVVCWMGGAESTPGVGACTTGLRSCIDGLWGTCDGQHLPAPEICNYLDDDCDNEIDDGVQTSTGTCPGSESNSVGPEYGIDFCDDPGVCDGVEETPEGWITLGGSTLSLTHIWIANSSENTVSKLDTRTGEEVGRFYTGLDPTNADPSRTAVDLDGSVYVGNRAFYPPGGGLDAQASVTKIAADERNCIDSDASGTIDTSTDWTPMDWGEDECILWTEEVGEPGCAARAVAVGVEEGLDGVRDSRVYVGCFYERRVYVLDGVDGEQVDEFDTDCVSPYGFAITGDNILFIAGLRSQYAGGSDKVGIVDLNESPPSVRCETPPDCGSYTNAFGATTSIIDSYGIAADDEGRLWTCNLFGCVTRYDPDGDDWDYEETDNCRGIAVDGEGFIWTAHGERAEKFDPDSMSSLAVIDTGGAGSLGVAIDFEGDVWVVNEGTDDASEIDADDEELIGRYPVGEGPYTYSDMTGFQLRNITAPSGTYRRIMEVCPEQFTDW